MRATRRNVLVILGVLTIAGGALFGTGAFTQVEAERSVDVGTQGDASAQLGLEITDDSLAGGGDTIEFTESQLNENATTTYNGSFVVTNNDADTTIGEVLIEDGDGNSLVDATGEVMYFEQETGSTDLTEGDSITYNVVFDTTNGDISEAPDDVTIVANEA